MAPHSPQYIGRIVVNPKIMFGKPIVSGTRVPVETVLKFLANTLDVDELLAAYPSLTRDDVKACLSYAHALAAGEDIYVYDENRISASATS